MSETQRVETADGYCFWRDDFGKKWNKWSVRHKNKHRTIGEKEPFQSLVQELYDARAEIQALKKELSDDDTRIFKNLKIKVRTEPVPPGAEVIEIPCEEEFVRDIQDPSPWINPSQQMPEDGTPVLIHTPSGFYVAFRAYSFWKGEDGFVFDDERVQGWMEIPRTP